MVQASPAAVWEVLADIPRWPRWRHEVRSASIDGVPRPGADFRWTVPIGTIHARVRLFEPGHRIGWTGRFLVFHAVHVWTLTAMADGVTAVRTEESMSGWPIGLVLSSKELADSNQQWLADLCQRLDTGCGIQGISPLAGPGQSPGLPP